jgi:hypothetical protein
VDWLLDLQCQATRYDKEFAVWKSLGCSAETNRVLCTLGKRSDSVHRDGKLEKAFQIHACSAMLLSFSLCIEDHNRGGVRTPRHAC